MGASVFHGGFSTFLAIATLARAKLYSIMMLYKIWVSIIGFGLLNGIILLPVILSFLGPIDYRDPDNKVRADTKESEISN